ncbi:MAG: hypothetical protein AB8A49_08215 [Prochlorococcus sp.]
MPSSAISGSPLILASEKVTLLSHCKEWQQHYQLVAINHAIHKSPHQV